MHVLDVGTGTGLLAREIAHVLGSSGRVSGVDPSWNMMAQGRARLKLRSFRESASACRFRTASSIS